VYNGGGASLASLYDAVCTAYYPELSPKMSIDSTYEFGKVFLRDFEALSTKIGISAKTVLDSVTGLICKLMAVLEKKIETDAISRDLATLIYNRCLEARKGLSGFSS
jgi:hypothetical protein